MKNQNVKMKTFKRTGWILIVCGLVGNAVTAAEIMTIRSGEKINSASALAEAISSALVPAAIGVVLSLAGLIIVLLGWWHGRPMNQTTTLRSAP